MLKAISYKMHKKIKILILLRIRDFDLNIGDQMS